MDLAALDAAQPHAFYLDVEPSMEALADCHAVVGGVRLPLHSQVLSFHSKVLRELFLAQREGGISKAEQPDLSAAFAGCSLEDAACLLRLIYFRSEDCCFQVLLAAGRLPGVAALAHKLDVGLVLSGIEKHLEGAMWGASIAQLLCGLQAARACRSEQLEAMLLDEAAYKFITLHKSPEDEQALAALGTYLKTQLLLKLSQCLKPDGYTPPKNIFGVRSAATNGGFTFCLAGFSKHQDARMWSSPVVEVGGVRWRLEIYPKDMVVRRVTHLSAFLMLDVPGAEAAGLHCVTADFILTAIDQQQGGRDHQRKSNFEFLKHAIRGWSEFVLLADLRAPGYAYLDNDRLLLRADITIKEVQLAP